MGGMNERKTKRPAGRRADGRGRGYGEEVERVTRMRPKPVALVGKMRLEELREFVTGAELRLVQ